MLTLIAIVLIGISFALVATQNTAPAVFNFFGFSWTLPVYVIVLATLLVGFFISWIINSISSLGTWSILHGKDKKIHEGQETLSRLQNRVRQLELENATLLGQTKTMQGEKTDRQPVNAHKDHNFLDRFKKNPVY